MTTTTTTTNPEPAPPAGLGGQLLAALLRAAEKANLTALVGMSEPPLGVVVLPDIGAGVVIVERGDDDPAALQIRLDTILRGHGTGILHLVLAGGSAADRPTLLAADRQAPDPNRLGVHLLQAPDRLQRVAGRRLGLLGRAASLLRETPALSAADLIDHNVRTKQGRDQAAAFAATLDHRPQRAIRFLGAACIVMFALTHLWGRRSFDLALLQMGANSVARVQAGEVWRLVSHAFLHGNEAHLIVNLIGLFSFGGFLEGLLGWRRMVLLYCLSALGGGLAAVAIGHVELSVGASGALWGLMAAGIGIVLRRDAILPPLIGNRLRPRLLAVLALNVIFSVLSRFVPSFPRIDLWAHFGGGVVGLALAGTGILTRGLLAELPPSSPSCNPRWLRAGALAALAMMVLAVGTALAVGQPWQPQVTIEPDQLT